MIVYKTDLQITDRQTIMLPEGAILLDVQTQRGEPKIWALCDQHAELKPIELAIYGTGQPLPDKPGEYVATFLTHDGMAVWHAFKLGANYKYRTSSKSAENG